MKSLLPRSFSNTQKGFTLVELMVVIAILAVLAVVGVSVFSGAQKNARDGRRRNDIDALSKSLETVKDPTAAVYTYTTATYTGDFPDSSARAKDPSGAGVANSPDYCISTATTTTTPQADPTTWAANTDCPTVPAADATYTAYTVFVDGTTVQNFAANTRAWKLCARMENNGTFYCKSNVVR